MDNNMLEKELRAVSEQIGGLIAADPFPDKVEPAFLRDAVRDYPGRGGKRLRPAMLLWCCGMLGGNPEQALNAAAAVEIFHNWTLVHDDIIDHDDLRRGRPTCHVGLAELGRRNYALETDAAGEFGTGFAILAGDLQQAWANSMLLGSAARGVSAELTVGLALRMQHLAARELISGEALDVEFSYLDPAGLTAGRIDHMLYLKTGALLRFSAETGAMIALNRADPDDDDIAAAGEFAARAGIAFQYRDDWLGLFGDQQKLGKPIGSDLAEAKPTLLLTKALELLPDAGRCRLIELLGLENHSPAQLDTARKLISDCGAETMVLKEAERQVNVAAGILNRFPDNRYRRQLSALLDYLIGRML